MEEENKINNVADDDDDDDDDDVEKEEDFDMLAADEKMNIEELEPLSKKKKNGVLQSTVREVRNLAPLLKSHFFKFPDVDFNELEFTEAKLIQAVVYSECFSYFQTEQEVLAFLYPFMTKPGGVAKFKEHVAKNWQGDEDAEGFAERVLRLYGDKFAAE